MFAQIASQLRSAGIVPDFRLITPGPGDLSGLVVGLYFPADCTVSFRTWSGQTNNLVPVLAGMSLPVVVTRVTACTGVVYGYVAMQEAT